MNCSDVAEVKGLSEFTEHTESLGHLHLQLKTIYYVLATPTSRLGLSTVYCGYECSEHYGKMESEEKEVRSSEKEDLRKRSN